MRKRTRQERLHELRTGARKDWVTLDRGQWERCRHPEHDGAVLGAVLLLHSSACRIMRG